MTQSDWLNANAPGPPCGTRGPAAASSVSCLFMVADRVDFPGGWRANRPLAWFLEDVATVPERRVTTVQEVVNPRATAGPGIRCRFAA